MSKFQGRLNTKPDRRRIMRENPLLDLSRSSCLITPYTPNSRVDHDLLERVGQRNVAWRWWTRFQDAECLIAKSSLFRFVKLRFSSRTVVVVIKRIFFIVIFLVSNALLCIKQLPLYTRPCRQQLTNTGIKDDTRWKASIPGRLFLADG